MEPEIFINFKHYDNAVGTNSEKLLTDFKSIKKQNGLYYCMAETDLYLQKSFPGLHIYGQHVDSNGYGVWGEEAISVVLHSHLYLMEMIQK